jgi:CRP-like cAMP-binding protein
VPDIEPSIGPGHPANGLLAALPRPERRRFLTACAPVGLGLGQVLASSGERIRHVYFPTRSYISLSGPTNGASWLAVGLVGDEGMLGMFLALGIDVSPLHATVHGEGAALRMGAAAFRRQLVANPGLLRVLNRYCCVQVIQLAQTAACNRFHLVEQRLARRLLMTHDRAHSGAFRVTQEALAGVLGVRRAGVNAAAMALQRRGLIRYHRGEMTILDRHGLEAAACECYAADNAIYRQMMGWDSSNGARGVADHLPE